ncbi:DUF4132 domain-containing protein, partial [Arachnia propionica]
VVSDAAADDLGLRVTPFELAYDLSREVVVEVDEEPFDPEAEAERAARILTIRSFSNGYWTTEWTVFSEPLFTTVPRPERLQWWREHFAAMDDKRRVKDKSGYPEERYIQLPGWLQLLLDVPWQGRLLEQAAGLGNLKAHALAGRPLVTTLTAEERQTLDQRLTSPLLIQNRYGNWELSSPDTYLRATFGLLDPEEARQITAQVPAGALAETYDSVSALVGLILPTPEERVAFARRTSAKLLDWDEAVPWLIGTGSHGLDLLLSWISTRGKGEADAMARQVAAVAHGPGMTWFFLDMLATKAAPVAEEWLSSHVGAALAANLSPARAEALAPTLRRLPVAELRALAPQATPSTRKVIEGILAEADAPELPAETTWWVDAAATVPTGVEVPIEAAGLPPLVVEGHRLSVAQVGEVLRALSTEQAHPLVAAVRQRAEVTSRDRFAVAVFRAWIASGAAAKQSWCLTGAGWLGDSQFVAELTPLIRQWPGQSQHQRAVKGLTALRNVATDAALQAISGIAAKVKFAALKKRAGEAMDEIAAQRGFSRDELEDRILADGGLDERGTRIFSYGSRRFLAFVAPDGKIAARLLDVQDRPTGKVLTSLPAPNKSDDQEVAKTAKAAFAAMKKDLTALVKVQTSRFEQAMIQDRRWDPADHARFIAPHPVLRRLLAGVIWAIRDGDGTLVATARIDEDATLIDASDDPITVPEGGSIGIVHRLDLTDEQASRWGEVLADYELTTPFKQLDRPTFTLPTSQGEKLELQGIPEGKIPAAKLIGAFTKHGWQRGDAYDSGVYCIHYLPVAAVGVTVVARYDGMWMGSLAEQEDQQLHEVYIVEGIQDGEALGWGDSWQTEKLTKVPWRRLPAGVASEVVATIQQLSS